MYVKCAGKLWIAPFGSEFLTILNEVPYVYYRAGWVGPMSEASGGINFTSEDT